jgi:hypothetical protein
MGDFTELLAAIEAAAHERRSLWGRAFFEFLTQDFTAPIDVLEERTNEWMREIDAWDGGST